MTLRVSFRTGSIALAACVALLTAGAAWAAEEPPAGLEVSPPAEAASNPLQWTRGPGTAPIGADLAEMELTEDFVYLDSQGTQRLMELTQNPISGSEVATVAPVSDEADWFLIFEFDEVGYVSDDERDELDAEALLQSIREGNDAANAERRERGWGELQIIGWHEEPYYDVTTNNLRWAVMAESDGGRSVNRIVKLLGRKGVMTATLVAGPDELVGAAADVDRMLEGYQFRPGNTYAEYVPGTDKLAAYGLTALVVGGAGAALVKSGLLAKFWKPLVVALAALGAGIKRLFTGGRSSQHDPEQPIG